MPASATLYAMIHQWFTVQDYPNHVTGRKALCRQVTAVLTSQSLRPAARVRALPSAKPVSARQAFRCQQRALRRKALAPAQLTPVQVRSAVGLHPPRPGAAVLVALDSVRCGAWEVFTVGMVWAGRTVILGWRVLPYPWPKKTFTPAVCGLVREVAAAFPAQQQVHLVADRGFPSKAFFSTLQEVGWGWTVRLSSRNWVVETAAAGATAEDGYDGVVRGLYDEEQAGSWTTPTVRFGRAHRAVSGTLVVGRPAFEPPAHQQGPASRAARRRQAQRRLHDLHLKHPGQADGSALTDPWMALFTTLPPAQAVAQYRRRWAIEGSYRDAQSGWDGQHGWDLEAVVSAQPDAAGVEHLVGLWAVSALIQTWLGSQVVCGPQRVRQVAQGWTTTGRLSIWARGKLVLQDTTERLTTWLEMTMNRGAARLAVRGPTYPCAAA